MNRTQAIAHARSKVGRINRHASISYTITVPRKLEQPDGVTTEARSDTWAAILETRTMTIARIALREMGIKRPQIEYGRDGRTIETLVAAGVRNAKG